MSIDYKQSSKCSLCGDVKQYTVICYGDFDGEHEGETHEPEDCTVCNTLKEFVPKAFDLLKTNYCKLKEERDLKNKWRQKAISLRLELTCPSMDNYSDVH